MQGIHRGPVNSPHKWPVTRKMFPFDDVIMAQFISGTRWWLYNDSQHVRSEPWLVPLSPNLFGVSFFRRQKFFIGISVIYPTSDKSPKRAGPVELYPTSSLLMKHFPSDAILYKRRSIRWKTNMYSGLLSERDTISQWYIAWGLL